MKHYSVNLDGDAALLSKPLPASERCERTKQRVDSHTRFFGLLVVAEAETNVQESLQIHY